MSNRNILVAEDDEPFRRIICQLLQQRPEFAVTEVSDGLQAVQMARDLQPDLVLLDVGLPKLTGIEAAHEIHRIAPHTSLLLVSQNTSSDVIGEALRAGARGYVQKLRLHRDLLSAIEAVLRGEQFVSAELRLSDTTEDCCRHELLVCLDDTVLVDGLARFIVAALNSGSAVIAVVFESHRDSLLRALHVQDVETDVLLHRGDLVLLSSSDVLARIIVDDWPDASLLSKTVGDLIDEAAKNATGERRRVVTCGECAPILWEQGKVEAAIQLEHLWNQLTRKHGADTLCVYRWTAVSSSHEHFKELCAEHTAVFHRFSATSEA